MNKRNRVRYTSDLLPDSFKSVYVSWDNNCPVEASALNYCACGIRVFIPSILSSINIPRTNRPIEVLLPIDKKWLSGMCISSTNQQDGSISMGIYFYNPAEQNYLQDLLYKSLKIDPQSHSVFSHKWEELLEKLCNSDDPYLRSIGYAKKSNASGLDEAA
ncbi:MAG: hypothetical protein HXX11_15400 [Desulfuromonadales bacterium]|nr:hypothetical protein [Desulfuromonadales bacterium]